MTKRRKRTLLGLVLLLLVSTVWYAIRRFPLEGLYSPDSVTLYSIDFRQMDWEFKKGEPPRGNERLYPNRPYRILGQMELTDAETRRELLSAARADLDTAGNPAKCFDPRHLIRAKKWGQTFDYLICFECDFYEVYLNGTRLRGETAFGGNSSESLLNQLLEDAGIEIVPDR